MLMQVYRKKFSLSSYQFKVEKVASLAEMLNMSLYASLLNMTVEIRYTINITFHIVTVKMYVCSS